jgi:precorrin-6Y C5,15-methyltransferase (decarboxylating)
MRGARFARAVAFEREATRIAMVRENADRLGTPLLAVVEGELPATLARQPAPDAVFHGGDVSNDAVFVPAWKALRPGGRLVANAVTLEGEAALYARHAVHGGDLVRIDVSTLARIGGKRAMRPRMAVIQWRVMKPWDEAR